MTRLITCPETHLYITVMPITYITLLVRHANININRSLTLYICQQRIRIKKVLKYIN